MAHDRAATHWDAGGEVQASVSSATSRAQASAAMAQQARRKACELAARLDAAISLLQSQGGGVPTASFSP